MKKRILSLVLAFILVLGMFLFAAVTANAAATQTHTITFYVGSSIYETQKVEHGKYAKVPADPHREGYFFNNWCTEDGEEFDFSAPVTKDFDLVALFEKVDDEPQMHTITFRVLGEVYETQKVEHGKYAKVPADPYREGYFFNNWCTEDGEEFDFSAPVTKDFDLVALFEEVDEDEAPEKPDAPVIKVSSVASTGKNKVTWKAVARASDYEVYYCTSKNGTYTFAATTSNLSFTHNAAEAGTRYYYYVVAIDYDGNESLKSNILSRVCDLKRPVVKATNDAATGKVKLTWTKIDGAKSYKIYRATTKNGKYSLMKTVTGTSYINNTSKAGKLYYYKVIAVHENTNANSAYSAIVSRTCDLARPTITVKRSTSGKPRISWSKIEGAVKYEVWRSTSKNGKYIRIVTTKNLYQVNKNAVTGTTYYYKVKAIHSNTNANSAFSTIKYIKAK